MEMGRTATSHALERARGGGGRGRAWNWSEPKPAEALVQVGDLVEATVIVVGTAGESPIRARCWAPLPTSSCT